VVLYKIKRGSYYVADPAKGLVVLNEQDFNRNWATDTEANEGMPYC